MFTERLILPDLAATQRVALRLADILRHNGGLLAIDGDLGAGKTTLVQALATALGVTQPVTSPTFALVAEYPLPTGGLLVHMDLYRLAAQPDLESLGFDDYLAAGNIIAIEWAERAAGLLPAERIHLTMRHLPTHGAREVLLELRGKYQG